MTMVQVPEGTTVSTRGQHYVQYKEGHAYQGLSFKLSSGHIRFVNWTMSSCLTSQLACSILWGRERQIFLNLK